MIEVCLGLSIASKTSCSSSTSSRSTSCRLCSSDLNIVVIEGDFSVIEKSWQICDLLETADHLRFGVWLKKALRLCLWRMESEIWSFEIWIVVWNVRNSIYRAWSDQKWILSRAGLSATTTFAEVCFCQFVQYDSFLFFGLMGQSNLGCENVLLHPTYTTWPPLISCHEGNGLPLQINCWVNVLRPETQWSFVSHDNAKTTKDPVGFLNSLGYV
jgi:hypothetical protein